MILGFLQEEELESRVVNDHAVAQPDSWNRDECAIGVRVCKPILYFYDVCLVKAPGFGGECLLNKPFDTLVVIVGEVGGHNLVITYQKLYFVMDCECCCEHTMKLQ